MYTLHHVERIFFFFFFGALELGHPTRRTMGGTRAPCVRGAIAPLVRSPASAKLALPPAIFRHFSCTAPRYPSRPSGGTSVTEG